MYQYKGTILEVTDGDTIVVDVDLGFMIRQVMIFRLYGINTPEVVGIEKAEGLKSKQFVIDKLKETGLIVTLDTYKDKKEKYGRYLATVILADGTILNDLLVAQGLATVYFGKGPKT